MPISPEKTAIATGVSASAKKLLEQIPKGATIIDYGAGKLRNTHFLSPFYTVWITDTKKQLERFYLPDRTYETPQSILPNHFDAALCSYVLNVIPDYYERLAILFTLYHILQPGAFLFIEVRRERGILASRHLKAYKDGYLIGNQAVKTFQIPYTKESLTEFIAQTPFFLHTLLLQSDSLIAICQKRRPLCSDK